MESKPSKEQSYSEATLEEARTGIRILAVLAFCLFPVFTLLDYFTQRDHYGTLSLIRFSTTIFYLGAHLLFRKNIGLKHPILTSNVLLGVGSLSITLMCLVLGGSPSPYYAGVNMVVLAGVLILPTRARDMAKTVGLIIGIYLAGVILREGSSLNAPALVNNLFFLCSTGIIGTTASHLRFKMKNALDTRDGFISMASHELRSPLTSMKLQMDLALMRLKSEEPDRDHIHKSVSNAYRQIHHINRLVDEMLDVSRIQSGKFIIERSPVELNDLVSGVLLRYYSEQMSSGKLKHFSHPDLLKGSWDPFKIEQVIVNLINNAVRYGEGSEVKLEVSREENFAVVSVSDKGPGIRPEDQDRIFEKFERGQSSRSGGLGLGLYISREIVEGHEGKLTLVSVPGSGTTFRILLPLN